MTDAVSDPFGWVGATLDAKYRVEAPVARGSFGVVYQGRHVGLGTVVAIKCLRVPDGLVGTVRETFFEDFIRESKAAQRLARASFELVEVLDVGVATSPEGATTPYLVLEWLSGRTLAADIAERGDKGLSIAEAVEILAPVARALSAAHAENLVHRDVKPDNVFLVQGGGAKLLDFGIAKVVGAATPKGAATSILSLPPAGTSSAATSFGMTPRYAAPELFKRTYGQSGPWTDVYAFGLTFVELVSGKPALQGDDLGDMYLASTNLAQRPTLRARGLEVPDSIESVLQRTLAVDPKRRYANAREMWDALTEAAREAPERSAPQRARDDTGRSRRAPLVLSGAIVLITAVGVVWATRFGPMSQGSSGGATATSSVIATSAPSASAAPPYTASASASASVRAPVDVPVTITSGVNSTGDAGKVPGMVYVPPSAFEMGGLNTDELPVHKVVLTKGFYMDRTEVTTEAYDGCIQAKACTQPRLHNGDEEKPDLGVCHSMKDPTFAKHPINCVDQAQAIAYCKWTGRRLPTEAEWELSARGTDGRAFPWGNSEPTSCSQVILTKMQGACGDRKGTSEVGTTVDGVSPFGAFDMAGNVWEWTADAFEPYTSAEVHDPYVVPKPTTARGVLRGGSWDFTVTATRSSTRYPFWRTSGHMSVGFRCAKDPE